MQGDSAIDTLDYAITFPHVVTTRLKHPDELEPSSYICATILDGRECLEWYFKWMHGGKAYEVFVHSNENRSQSNVLTRANFRNIRRISGIGWGYADVEDLVDRECPGLREIRVETDLFDPDVRNDSIVVTVARSVYGHRGFKLANSTKLLYQKRPSYIPIFDDFVRRATNIPWVWDTPSQRKRGLVTLEKKVDTCPALENLAKQFSVQPNLNAITLGLAQFRALEQHSKNSQALQNLARWITSEPAVVDGVSLSRMRILDILSWSLIYNMSKKKEQPWIFAESEYRPAGERIFDLEAAKFD